MEKVLIELYIPAINETYDMFIPLLAPMYEVLDLVRKAVNVMVQDRYRAGGSSILCYRTGHVLNINLSVYELEIHNGSKLMLI